MKLAQLCYFIKSGLSKGYCNNLHALKDAGNQNNLYVSDFPKVTPQCLLSENNLETEEAFKRNFIDFSGYLYLYLDFPPEIDVIDYKQSLIDKHKDIVALVSVSHSMSGIDLLVRVDRNFSSMEDFKAAREWFIHTYFLNEEQYIHPQCEKINGLMYLPYDPDVYMNQGAFVHLPIAFMHESESVPLQYYEPLDGVENLVIAVPIGQNEEPAFYNPKWLVKIDNIEDILVEDDETWKNQKFQLRLKTKVQVHDEFFDFRPENFVELKLPPSMGVKFSRYRFSKFFRILLFLNPFHPEEVFHFLRLFNETRVRPKMSFYFLKEIFCNVYREMIAGKMELKSIIKKKKVHFNEESTITKNDKISAANKVSGANRSGETCQKVKECIRGMEKLKMKISIRRIAKHCKVSKTTADKYYKNPCPDPEAVIERVRADLNKKKGCCK